MTVIAQDLYPSRVSDRPETLPRQDPVVYGDPPGGAIEALTDKQLASYERDGYLSIPNFFSPEQLAACRAELERLRQDEAVKGREEAVVEPDGDELRSLFAVHRISDFFGQVASDERLVSAAMQILGSQVYIHQARVNLKPGFHGKEFYWHSDFETWHVEDGMPRMRAVSCSILLTDNYHFNGPLMLIRGSHRRFVTCVGETPDDHYKQSLRKQEYGVPDNESLAALAEEGGIDAPIGPAGSLVFFDSNTMHGSNGNISPYPRSNLFFVYNSVENRLADPYSGQKPRPEFIAAREHEQPLTPTKVDYAAAR